MQSKNREIVLVDKPAGITSFDVVRILRRRLALPNFIHPPKFLSEILEGEGQNSGGRGVKRVGHAGTLDPFATGLLIVGIGAGTKKLKEFELLPKTYVMEVLLGRRTDTGDPEGKTIEEMEVGFAHSREWANGKNIKKISLEQIKKILAEMEGKLELPIPQYSAVKHKGVPLYKYARRGIKLQPKMRTTEIFYLKLLGMRREGDGIVLKIEMKCEKGTYARAVGEEIGRRLGVPAMLIALRRTKIGDIRVEQAEQL